VALGQQKSIQEFKNSLTLTKRVKNGDSIKRGVPETEFVKMIRTGNLE
jgi:hypothetical protein